MTDLDRTFVGLGLSVILGFCLFIAIVVAATLPVDCECPEPMPQCERNEVIWWVNGERACLDLGILYALGCPGREEEGDDEG